MTEKRFTAPLTCAHCGNKAPMEVVIEYSRIEERNNEEDTFSWREGPFWEVLECPSCGKVIFQQGYWHECLPEECGPEILYPAGVERILGLPERIAKACEAAQKVKAIDSNAFAVLLGRVLDLVCIDKNAVGESLYERLSDIANKGVMPRQLAEMAHALRQLRNIGAHADLGELTKAEVPILEALSKAILEYVYSAPALIQLVQAKIDSLKSRQQ